MTAQRRFGPGRGELDGAFEKLTIACPSGAGPGDTLEVETEKGDVLEIVIPGGISAGEEFEVRLASSSPGRGAVMRSVAAGAARGKLGAFEQELADAREEISAGASAPVAPPFAEGAVAGTDWSVYFDTQGKAFFQNRRTSATVWEPPAEVLRAVGGGASEPADADGDMSPMRSASGDMQRTFEEVASPERSFVLMVMPGGLGPASAKKLRCAASDLSGLLAALQVAPRRALA